MAAQAAMASARLDLDYTRIYARRSPAASPTAGSTSAIWSPSETLLTTIVSLNPIYFVFDMSEADFLAYQRAVLAGQLPSTRDRSTDRQASSWSTRTTGAARAG